MSHASQNYQHECASEITGSQCFLFFPLLRLRLCIRLLSYTIVIKHKDEEEDKDDLAEEGGLQLGVLRQRCNRRTVACP